VRRALLVLAMLFSLWPAAVIAAAAAGSSSKGTSSPSGRQPDYERLKELRDQEGQLVQRLHNSESLHGTADPGLAYEALRLASDYQSWQSSNSGLNAQTDKIEGLEVRIVQRLSAFAEHPSQPALDAFDSAVSEYDKNAP
jgi:hypothetical protein